MQQVIDQILSCPYRGATRRTYLECQALQLVALRLEAMAPVEPGGVINLVSEQPLSEPSYDLTFRAGNRGLIEPNLDISGPLTEDGRVLYRLNALYRNERAMAEKFAKYCNSPWTTSESRTSHSAV